MKPGYKIVLVVFGFCLAVSLWAQPKVAVSDNGKGDTTKKKKETPVYLGHTRINGGNISRSLFDSLIKQGIVAKDSAGHTYPIDGFLFTYAELRLYTDSMANLMWLTDYDAEYCNGDTLTTDAAAAIYDRLKVGDTLYFDNISINYGKGAIVTNGRPMRFEITSK